MVKILKLSSISPILKPREGVVVRGEMRHELEKAAGICLRIGE